MLPIVLLFFNNWLYSYKKSELHPSNQLTMQDCLFLIQYHNIVGCILSATSAMLIGKYTDRMRPRISLGIGYSAGATILVCMYLTTPGTWFFYLSAPLFHLTLTVKMIAVRAYSQRMFPVEIRSTLLGNISFGVAVCLLIMILVYDYVFHTFGSSSPFLVAACIDVFLLLAVFFLSGYGLIT